MFKTLANAWRVEDLRKKLIFTILIILLYRLGSAIPVPFASSIMIADGSTFQFINTLSGGAFEQASLFALGVSPYITASIVIQLLTVALPPLERLAKQGEEGKKKITQITRYITIGIALVTGIGYYFLLQSQGGIQNPFAVTSEGGQVALNWLVGVTVVACYCAGSSIVMWLAERINEHGIGNGISVILFANIVSRALPLVLKFINMFKLEMNGMDAATGANDALDMQIKKGLAQFFPKYELFGNKVPVGSIIFTVLVLAGLLAMMWFIIFISDSERRIPVQYAKRVVGRKMYGGQNSNIPLKLNMAGVMPVIFANAIITIPTMVAQFIPVTEIGSDGQVEVKNATWAAIVQFFSDTSWFYCILTFGLILAFAYFYVAISFNPNEVSGNLQKQGGAIPGIRPGKATSTFIQKVLSKITFIGALALSLISVVPLIIHCILDVLRHAEFIHDSVPAIETALWSFTYLSELATIGTSIIIVVGVILEIVRDIEAQMTMRHYKGFLG
ncbi:MAG: preprotein translocase subunit SecY [Clostridia bacterium]|nr:preprotein translocase subunit SecY [Clostridia bacterium]